MRQRARAVSRAWRRGRRLHVGRRRRERRAHRDARRTRPPLHRVPRLGRPPRRGGRRRVRDDSWRDARAASLAAALARASFSEHNSVVDLGRTPGAAHATKALNNGLNSAHLALGAEALLALERACDVRADAALAAINASSGRSLQTIQRLPEEVLTRRFGYGFQLGLMLKDVRNAAATARAAARRRHGGRRAPARACRGPTHRRDCRRGRNRRLHAAGRAPRAACRPRARRRRGARRRGGAAPPAAAAPSLALFEEKRIELLVCDMAGTTVDEQGLVYSTLRACMNDAGLDVSEAEMHARHGAQSRRSSRTSSPIDGRSPIDARRRSGIARRRRRSTPTLRRASRRPTSQQTRR